MDTKTNHVNSTTNPDEKSFIGPFTELNGDPELWGGDMTGAEYADLMRKGRRKVKEIETW